MSPFFLFRDLKSKYPVIPKQIAPPAPPNNSQSQNKWLFGLDGVGISFLLIPKVAEDLVELATLELLLGFTDVFVWPIVLFVLLLILDLWEEVLVGLLLVLELLATAHKIEVKPPAVMVR